METWRYVKGFEGKYEVSSLGRVRSLPRVTQTKMANKKMTFSGRMLRQKINKHGYWSCVVQSTPVRLTTLAHRLVAIAFIPNPENKLEVNHINGVKTDNRIENLEWATRKENADHGAKMGLILNHGGDNPGAKRVLNTRTGVVYSCAKETALLMGIETGKLRRMLRGQNINKTDCIYL